MRAANAPVPSGLSNIVAVSVGSGGLALKADGTVVGWGSWGPEVSSKLGQSTNVVAISGGCGCVLALTTDGKVVAIDRFYQPLRQIASELPGIGQGQHNGVFRLLEVFTGKQSRDGDADV